MDPVEEIGPCRARILGEPVPCNRMDDALPGLQAAVVPQWRGRASGAVTTGDSGQVGDPVRLSDATSASSGTETGGT